MRRAAIVCVSVLWLVPVAAAGGALSRAEVDAITRTVDAYRDAWRNNDAAAVMATLTPDAILLPAHARGPISGGAAIRRFWWPADAAPTRIVAFDSTIDDVRGSGSTGYARGTFTLRFRVGAEGEPEQLNIGSYLMVLERQDDGRWLIACRMWDDRLR